MTRKTRMKILKIKQIGIFLILVSLLIFLFFLVYWFICRPTPIEEHFDSIGTMAQNYILEDSSDDEVTEAMLEEIRQEELMNKQLLYQLVMAEAGNQPLTGMRLVVDVVLNRVDDPRFPNTIYDVIFEDNPIQFSVTANGMFEAAASYISDNAKLAVELELGDLRLDYGVLYFSSTTDPINGEKAFKYFDHWFSY